MITRNKQKRMVLNQREQHSKRRTLFLFNTIFSFSDEVHDVEISRLTLFISKTFLENDIYTTAHHLSS